MGLMKGDSICFASVCQDGDAVMVACSQGKVATFPVDEIRVSGRTASGVRGKKLAQGVVMRCASHLWLLWRAVQTVHSRLSARRLPGTSTVAICLAPSAGHVYSASKAIALRHRDSVLWCAGHKVVGAGVLPMSGLKSASREAGPWLLMAASSGHGKRVPLSDFRFTARGVAGVIGIKLEEGTSIVNVHVVSDGGTAAEDDRVSECLLASSGGMMSRIALHDISVYGRTARGVRIVKLKGGDQLSSITPCKYRHMSC